MRTEGMLAGAGSWRRVQQRAPQHTGKIGGGVKKKENQK